MKFIINSLIYIYSFFCSLKLAIFTLLALILLFAVGTFYESAQGRVAAKELIYRSIWMTALISLLALNIIAVMIDRYPWKKRHIPFLLAHFGIILVIVGSVITRFYGVDGSMRLTLGEKGSQIVTESTLLMVYSSFDAKNLTELYRKKVHFFRHPPKPKKPHVAQIGSQILKVTQFYPLSLAREQYKPSLRGGPAVRFQIEGSRAQIVKWMFKPPWMDKVQWPLGPAEIVLSSPLSLKKTKSLKPVYLSRKKSEKKTNPKLTHGQNQDRPRLLLISEGKKLKYKLQKPGSKKIQEGFLQTSSALNRIKTGWMDFEFRLLEYIPKALPNTLFIPQKRAGEQTNSAIQVEFKGEQKWMGLNSYLFFFDEDKVYVVAYINEKQNLGFQLELKNFKVTRYPSSFKAAGYESKVLVNQKKKAIISMNHPLKFAGYTLYQSGFEEDEKGTPVASVFSINKDPGRFIKYFGSLLIVLGSFVLFLRRNLRSHSGRKKNHKKVEDKNEALKSLI